MSRGSSSASCDYCGLPVSTGRRGAGRDSREPQFCCLGCRVAASVAGVPGSEGQNRTMLARLGFALFFSMNVMVFTLALWSHELLPASDNAHAVMADGFWQLFRYAALLCSLPVLLLLGEPLASQIGSAWRNGSISTDMLILGGVVAAYLYSVVTVIRGEGQVYFEVPTMVLVLVTFGRWIEATAKLQGKKTLESLENLLPAHARIVAGAGWREVPRAEVAPGDRLLVKAGERFPLDGCLVEGLVEVDEQIVTGESRPVEKQPGSPLLGGTLNIAGNAVVIASSTPGEDTLSRLVRLMRQAQLSRGRYQRLADAATRWFVPGVSLLALAVAGYATAHQGGAEGIMRGLAVALIACPCALGLATPLAYWSATLAAGRRQVLFRDVEALERLAGIRAIRFDKTGTITTGQPMLSTCIAEHEDRTEEIQQVALGLAWGSTHAFAGALRRCLSGQASASFRGHQVFPGRGVSAQREDEGRPAWLGNRQFMEESGQHIGAKLQEAIDRAETEGDSYSLIGWGGEARGMFVFAESPRPQAAGALADCAALEPDISILTGDHVQRARRLARELGIPADAGQLPQDKVQAVLAARERQGSVAMVGDGVNDAPALAASDVGIALGCGADLTREAADVCLLAEDLRLVPWSVRLARRTVRIVRQNLAWCFAYNGVGIALAASGRLNPVIAAGLMAGSSLLVVGNSLRLLREEPGGVANEREPTSDNLSRKASPPTSAPAPLSSGVPA